MDGDPPMMIARLSPQGCHGLRSHPSPAKAMVKIVGGRVAVAAPPDVRHYALALTINLIRISRCRAWQKFVQ